MAGKNLHQWSVIFKALGNSYRLQIIKLLKKQGKMSVSDITGELGISIKNTSRNLIILQNVDILKSLGKSDHVYYEINPELTKDLKRIIGVMV